MKINQKAHIQRAFTQEDIQIYRDLGGHGGTDAQVPEPLLAALFSYLLGMELPGIGTNYLKQETYFCNPAYVGELLRASVQVTRIRKDKQLVDLKTICTNPKGHEICTGRALVYVGDVQ